MLTEIAALTSQIAVATLFGSMAFFTGVIAPLVFTKLEAAVAGGFIRALFPWYTWSSSDVPRLRLRLWGCTTRAARSSWAPLPSEPWCRDKS